MINIQLLESKMKEKELSINELSRLSDVDKSVISRILSGKTNSCTLITANKLSKALKLSNKETISIFFA